MTETAARRSTRRALAGILSNIQQFTVDGVPVATATLTTTVRGTTTVREISAEGDVVARIAHLLAEGPVVRLYAEVADGVAVVLGPDLTARTLARQAPAGAPAPTKRPRTEAQKKAWAEVILPRLQAGRARAAAARQAEKAPRPRPPARWIRSRSGPDHSLGCHEPNSPESRRCNPPAPPSASSPPSTDCACPCRCCARPPATTSGLPTRAVP